MKRRLRLLTALSLTVSVLAGCQGRNDELGQRNEKVVYGADDREDVYAFADQAWAARVAEFTAALMPTGAVNQADPNNVTFPADTLADRGICADQRFADQQTAAFCSGTLIAPDLVLTAGHCVQDAADCAGTALVFNYYMDDASTLHTVTSADVYQCSEVVVQILTDIDYAVLRLDREVTGRTPAVVRQTLQALTPGTQLVVNGFPSGLPIKIDDGGAVRDGRAGTLDYFIANLDTFGGNSGSGVYDLATKELVGILVRGETDYVNGPDGCAVVNECADDGCRGEDSTYAANAIIALCDTGNGPGSLCTCGDGTCNPDDNEDTTTCPADCGTQCGDGVCNGDESPLNCTDDCGTCGNGVCDGTDDQDNCCTDCGCAGDFTCRANACIPDPGPGDTCADAFELEPAGMYVVNGETTTAVNDEAGSCGGDASNDRVYSFTLTGRTYVQVQATGYDTVLHLRAGDCADPGAEIACNDDATPPGNLGSRVEGILEAGTYYLFVEGFANNSGNYELAVLFEDAIAPSNDTCDGAAEIVASGTQLVIGNSRGATDDYAGSCGGDGAGEAVYTFTLDAERVVIAEVYGFDTVMYLRSDCEDAETEIACNDNFDLSSSLGSRIEETLEAGTYSLFVDAVELGGTYRMFVDFTCADETDSDEDETLDCLDGCVDDPDKVEAGQCGCGNSDADADGDGVADCNDNCPDDISKQEPGLCGCGVHDTDTDGDGTPDCNEEDDGGGCSVAVGGGSTGGFAVFVGLALLGLVRVGSRRRRNRR